MKVRKQEQVDALVALISERIASQPHERGGYLWAAQTQRWYCERLSISVETLRRIISKPPFVREQAAVGGAKVALLRVLADGEIAQKTDQRIANELRKIWLARPIDHAALLEASATGKPMKTDKLLADGKWRMSAKDHGCLIGLAQLWPDGRQHAMLKCVLKNWSTFMVGVKLKLAVEQDALTANPDMPVEGALYLKWPHLPTIRRFADVAIEVFAMELQMQSGGCLCN